MREKSKSAKTDGRTVENLRDNPHFIESLVETAPNVLYIFNLESNSNIFLSAQAERILGYSSGEFHESQNDFLDRFMHPEDLIEIKKYFGKIKRANNGEGFEFEYRLRHKSGEWRWFRSRDKIYRRNANGQATEILGTAFNITELKKTEEKLRENENQLRRVLDNLFAFVGILLPDGTLVEANRAPLAVAGLSASDVIGKKFWDCYWWNFSSATQEKLRDSVERAAGGETLRYDAEVRVANDARIWIDFQLAPMFDGEGRITHLIPSGLDISERKQTEEKLRDSEEKFRALADNISQLAWMADKSGSIFWYNERWYEFTGTAFDEMKGWGWQAVHHPDFVEPVTEKFKKAIADGTDWEDTFPIRSKDGEYCWFLSRAMPIRDDAGNIVRWFGTNTDVTENRRAALNSEFLASIGNDLAHISNPDEIMRVVGEKIGKFLGVSRCIFTEYDKAADEAAIIYDWSDTGKSSLVGVYKIADFIDEDVFAVLSSGKQLVVSDTATDERTSAKAEKHAALEIGAFANSPYLSDGQWKASLTVHNRTPRQWRDDELAILKDLASRAWVRIERARAEAERERLLERERVLRRQAEDANRLKDEFLATVSHGLRTPLNAILGWANLLQSGRATDEMIERANETIYRSAKAQAQLIEDLLDISRIITGKMKFEPLPVNLAEVVETAIDTIRPAADAKAISINTNYKDSCIVSGETQRLQQIVWNLVSNAVKFTPVNGLIEITLEVIDKHAVLIVKDSGKGIEAEFLPHIFERFRQEDASSTRRHGGLGLGLAIVRQLVELHGGTISADSAGENFGSTFTLELPLLILNEEKSKNLRESLSDGFTENHISKKLNSIKILLVDDELDTLELLELSLKVEGANVRAASSAATALKILQNFQPDVLISDIAMPDEDGYSLVKKVKQIADEKGINIPAIAMTAYVRVEDRNRVLASGFQMYVPKPAEPDELINAIAVLTAKT